MKLTTFGFLLLFTALSFVSCKKDEAKVDISGSWVGAWGFGPEVPSYYERWDLEEDGELTAYDENGLYAVGTWELNGKSFEATYTPIGWPYSYTFVGECGGGH